MEKLPFPKNVYVAIAGPVNAFLYFSVRRRFLGFSLSGWLKFLPLLLMVVAWLARWGTSLVLIGLLLAVVVRLVYWRARRRGYLRFMPDSEPQSRPAVEPIANNERIAVLATGTFSVGDRQAYVLQRPAQYWRVPMGDHAIMVQREPGRFMYQFVQADSLEKVEAGLLVFGRRPREALAVTFLTDWGPEQNEIRFNQFMPAETIAQKKSQYTIYLTFEDEAMYRRVWMNLMRNARPPAGAKS